MPKARSVVVLIAGSYLSAYGFAEPGLSSPELFFVGGSLLCLLGIGLIIYDITH